MITGVLRNGNGESSHEGVLAEDMYECKPQPKADEGDAVAPERRGP